MPDKLTGWPETTVVEAIFNFAPLDLGMTEQKIADDRAAD